MPFLAVAKMEILGIASIVIGLALVCGGIIFYPYSGRPSDESEMSSEDAGEVRRDQTDEPSESDCI